MNRFFFDIVFQFAHKSALLDIAGIFFAQYVPYALVLCALFLICGTSRDWRMRIFLACETALAVILSRGIFTPVIRFFYHHLRPFDALRFKPLIAETDWSFPSGHMTFLFALAMVVFFINRRWGYWYFAFAALVGVARVFVGVHWPLDILGGAVIGILCGLVIEAAVRSYRETLQHKANPRAYS